MMLQIIDSLPCFGGRKQWSLTLLSGYYKQLIKYIFFYFLGFSLVKAYIVKGIWEMLSSKFYDPFMIGLNIFICYETQ